MPWSIGHRLSLVGMITLGVNYGTRNTFGLFLRPLAEEFGSTRGLISLTMAMNFLVYGIVIFGVGWLIDRFGPRVVMAWGMVVGALAWSATSFAFSPVFMVFSFGMVFGLSTAMSGQVTCSSLIGKYVAQGAGPFLGYIGMGPGVGHFVFTPILSALIVFFSWRWAMAIVGMLFLASLLLPGVALRGVQPLARERGPSVPGLNMAECLPLIGQKSFPLLFTSFFCMAAGSYLYIAQIAACAEDRGLGSAAAALALVALSGTGVLISPIVGWTTNRLQNYRLVGVAIFLLAGTGMIVTRFSNYLFISSILVGIGYGGYVPVLPALAMKIYPRALYGRIWALITIGGCLGAALGTWAGGLIYDWAGDYDYAWWFAAVAFALAAACLLAIPEDRCEAQS